MTRTFLDASDVETTEGVNVYKVMYTIVVPIALAEEMAPSVSSIIVEKVDTEATIEIGYPSAESTRPLAG